MEEPEFANSAAPIAWIIAWGIDIWIFSFNFNLIENIVWQMNGKYASENRECYELRYEKETSI